MSARRSRHVSLSTFRLIGALVGLVILASALGDLFGIIPESPPATRNLADRLWDNSLPFVIGVLFVLPHRWFRRGRRYSVLFCCYAVLSLLALMLAIAAVWDYRTGSKHWLIIVVGIGFLMIPVVNMLALWQSRQRG